MILLELRDACESGYMEYMECSFASRDIDVNWYIHNDLYNVSFVYIFRDGYDLTDYPEDMQD